MPSIFHHYEKKSKPKQEYDFQYTHLLWSSKEIHGLAFTLTCQSRIMPCDKIINKGKQTFPQSTGDIILIFFILSHIPSQNLNLGCLTKYIKIFFPPSLWFVIYSGYHNVNNEMMLCIVLFLWVMKGRALALSCHCKWSWISDVSLQLMLMRKRILRQNLLLAQHTRKKPHRIPKGEGGSRQISNA